MYKRSNLPYKEQRQLKRQPFNNLPPDEPSEPDDDPDSDETELDEETALEPIPTSYDRFVAARRLLDGPDCWAKTTYLERLKKMDDHTWPVQFDRRFQ